MRMNLILMMMVVSGVKGTLFREEQGMKGDDYDDHK